jgi:acyl-coenzyme A synthetase/AMP-(fatty) acid ligase
MSSTTPTASLGELPELAAQRHGDTQFLCDAPWAAYGKPVRDVTGFAAAVRDYADRFWAAGIRHGDVVAIVQRNHIEVQAAACALCRIGALPVLLSARIEPLELLQCLAKLPTPHLVVDAVGLDRVAGAAEALREAAGRVLYLSPPEGVEDPDAAAVAEAGAGWLLPTADRQAHQARPRGEDEWVVITHSSGTTGVPKLAAHSTRSLYGMVAVQIALQRKYSDSSLSAKHLTFVHARSCSVVLGFLEVATPLLAIVDPDTDNVRRLMLEHRPGSVETHPNVYARWEALAAHPSRPFSAVRRYISTFDAMHPRTIRNLIAGSDDPNAHYIQGYGQTETGAVTARMVTRAEAETYRPRNVGRPVDGAQVRVVDESGYELEAGRLGHIECKAPGRFRGYVGEQPPDADAWWPMGDLGRMKLDGSLELLDRAIDHARDTDSLLEKEDVLLDLLPELLELVLVSSVGDADIVAVACPRDGTALDAGRFAAAAAGVGLAEVPLHVWRFEDLPLTGSYKVRRGVLRQLLLDQAADAVPLEVG